MWFDTLDSEEYNEWNENNKWNENNDFYSKEIQNIFNLSEKQELEINAEIERKIDENAIRCTKKLLEEDMEEDQIDENTATDMLKARLYDIITLIEKVKKNPEIYKHNSDKINKIKAHIRNIESMGLSSQEYINRVEKS